MKLYGLQTPFYNCCAYYIISSFRADHSPGYMNLNDCSNSLYVAAVRDGQLCGPGGVDIAKALESYGWVRVKSARSHHGSYDVHLYVSPRANAAGKIEAFPVPDVTKDVEPPARDARGRFTKQRFKTGGTK